MSNAVSRPRLLATLLLAALVLVAASTRLQADSGGVSVTLPFTDVSNTNIFFCAIAAAYFSGLTNGTSATTYSPSASVPREQMAAFVSRTLDQSLRRGSRRAALNQWWTPTVFPNHSKTPVDAGFAVAYDGADLWTSSVVGGTVRRVRASDGFVLQTWTGANNARGVLVAQGAVYITGNTNPGRLYIITPTTPGVSPPVSLVTDQLGGFSVGIAFDGVAIWTANHLGSVSRVSNGVMTVSEGFVQPWGMLYDGANIWITDSDNRLKKLNSDASIASSITVGNGPGRPAFDGANIWVPNESSNSVTVVRVKDALGNPLASPFVLATLTGNGLSEPLTAAFDGQRILVTNYMASTVSLWKAADLTPLGSVPTGALTGPAGACSDGVNFWVTLFDSYELLRF